MRAVLEYLAFAVCVLTLPWGLSVGSAILSLS